MTREIEVQGWKVRVVVPGALLHFVSATEPVVTLGAGGRVADLAWTPTDGGDIPGYIDWGAVVAVTWREGR